MALDLLSIEPHKVSRDLSGYITYLYGPPKVGKTTFGSQTPSPLLLAFERGYNALQGIHAIDVPSWTKIKEIVRELRKPAVQEKFKTIIVDTVDIAATLCDKYVCSQNDVETISQIPYGQGWVLLKREFDDVFRSIAQMGYALVFISHSKEVPIKGKNSDEYMATRPSVGNTYNSIIENMADIYAYMHPEIENGVSVVKMDLRSTDGTVFCGGRFKYIVPQINASYDNLVKALNDAIDKESELNGGKYVTDERNITPEVPKLDYDALMKEFNEMVNTLMAKDKTYYTPRITFIVEKYLGKGKKVSESTLGQVELIDGIVEEIKSELMT